LKISKKIFKCFRWYNHAPGSVAPVVSTIVLTFNGKTKCEKVIPDPPLTNDVGNCSIDVELSQLVMVNIFKVVPEAAAPFEIPPQVTNKILSNCFI